MCEHLVPKPKACGDGTRARMPSPTPTWILFPSLSPSRRHVCCTVGGQVTSLYSEFVSSPQKSRQISPSVDLKEGEGERRRRRVGELYLFGN